MFSQNTLTIKFQSQITEKEIYKYRIILQPKTFWLASQSFDAMCNPCDKWVRQACSSHHIILICQTKMTTNTETAILVTNWY